jgi:hypothetical protein
LGSSAPKKRQIGGNAPTGFAASTFTVTENAAAGGVDTVSRPTASGMYLVNCPNVVNFALLSAW